ncbi:restriction endonuclease fold toxin-2 domain-containing protein [Actinomyces wuliandei]|uniref:restriction endonuclease fold toxin-2 domain-containing protein n=1 Tax=Actinomyces wuliandei TaxID=2057743 RepID=UPI00111A0560|nr:restriction endonuclease fold toxin-2 domain-containing protein [Actinomyces wuliandei]
MTTQRNPPSTEAYRYQHRVLGTDVERELVADDGEAIMADAVLPDGTAYAAYDAKHTSGGPTSMYEGRRPPFIQDKLMGRFDDEMERYGKVIASRGNPVTRLVVVTNTPRAQAYLAQRVQALLGPDAPVEVRLLP